MSLQTWQETLITAQIDGTAYTNATAETSIIPAAAKFTLPADFFYIGRALRVTAKGRISNAASATIIFNLKFGSINAFASGTLTLNATSKSNVTFLMDILLTCRAIGASTSANLMGIGQFQSEAAIGVGTGTFANSMSMPAGSPTVGAGFDSKSAQVVDLTGTWGAASASNSIQVHEYMLESLN